MRLRKVTLITVCLVAGSALMSNMVFADAGRLIKRRDVNGTAPDLESAKCLSCHDGSFASDVTSGLAPRGMRGFLGKESEHPIGMYYSAVGKGKFGKYVPRGVLNPAIVLVDGRVSCVSCHVKDSAKDNRLMSTTSDHESCTGGEKLAVSNYGSGLCLSCHIK